MFTGDREGYTERERERNVKKFLTRTAQQIVVSNFVSNSHNLQKNFKA
jgi:hypothetical protein